MTWNIWLNPLRLSQQCVCSSNICWCCLCPLQTLDDEPVAIGKEYQWQNRPVSEWTNQQVCHWLMGMNMDQYTPEFTAKGVDGQQLLQLDSDKLKVKKEIAPDDIIYFTWSWNNGVMLCFYLFLFFITQGLSVQKSLFNPALSDSDCHLVARSIFSSYQLQLEIFKMIIKENVITRILNSDDVTIYCQMWIVLTLI